MTTDAVAIEQRSFRRLLSVDWLSRSFDSLRAIGVGGLRILARGRDRTLAGGDQKT
jgi:hypothetical protein